MTAAARRFLDEITIRWDSLEPWEQTIKAGLCEHDRETLLSFCEDDNDVGQVFAEVFDAITAYVRARGGHVQNRNIWNDINQEEL